MDQVIKDYEAVLKENDHLTESLKQSQEKLKYFNDLKDSLNQSIIVAQEAADKVKANSQREAEIINREAQKQGQDIIDQANDKARHIIEEASKRPRSWHLKPTICASGKIFRQKLQVMMESQLEVVKGSEWDEILQQGETTSYEAIQEAIRRDETLDKEAAKEVKSFSNDSEDDVYYQNAVEDGEVDDSEEADAVVVFPESDVDAGGQHFADEAEENM